MKDASRHNQSGITASIDEVCDEFERHWQAGSPRPIGEFVDRVTGQEQARLVCELAMLDASYLQRQGGAPNWKALQVQFPAFKDAIREAFRQFSSAAKTAAWQPEQELDTAKPKHAAGVQASAKAKLPRRFGHFEIRTILGRGAFGTVFRAYDTRLHRDVALKIPRGGVLADSDHAERFIREARAASQLRHPSIVTVHDVGEVSGTVYIACELIDGPTLQKLLADGYRPKARQVASFMRSLAVALHSAHSRGIIHRDLKPANILLDGEGKPHIADFGLARTLEQDSGLTIEGTVLGTPAYMSPEQALGRGHLADARSDLWSLGVIFYELLTLKRPFEGSTMEVLEAVRSLEPVSPRTINREAPRDLETICLKCLVKDPDGRYPSAQHLAEDIDRWRSGKPIHARNVNAAERFLAWIRLNPSLASALAAVVLTVMVGLVAVTSQWRRAERNLREADNQRQVAERSLLQAERSQREADNQRQLAERNLLQAERSQREAESNLSEAERQRREAQTARDQEKAERERADGALRAAHEASYTRNVMLAGHEWRANNISEVTKLLDECPPEMRGWEWGYLKNQCAPWFSCRGDVSREGAAAVNMSGRLAAVSDTKGIHLWDLVSRQLLRTLENSEGDYGRLLFSSDSEYLAAHDQSRAYVWRVKNGTPIELDWKGLGKVSTLGSSQFSPIAPQFLVRDTDKAARIWDLETQQILVDRPHPDKWWFPHAYFGSDGKRVFIDGALYSSQSGDLIRRAPTDGQMPPMYSQDLKLILVIAKNRDRCSVVDADTHKELWSKPMKGVSNGSFSPDSSLLALDVGEELRVAVAKTGIQLAAMRKRLGASVGSVPTLGGRAIAR